MRRQVSVMFMIAAVLAIFTHMAVPHHHLCDGHACLVSAVECDHHHSHHDGESEEQCPLEEMIPVLSQDSDASDKLHAARPAEFQTGFLAVLVSQNAMPLLHESARPPFPYRRHTALPDSPYERSCPLRAPPQRSLRDILL